MDRGRIDFERLYAFMLSLALFVVRTKGNVLLQRRYSLPVDKSTGVRSDQTVVLGAAGPATAHLDALRRVSYFDAVTGKRSVFLTNHFTLPALTIAQIYKQRWQVELFFENTTWCTPSYFIESQRAVLLNSLLAGMLPGFFPPRIARRRSQQYPWCDPTDRTQPGLPIKKDRGETMTHDYPPRRTTDQPPCSLR